MYPKCSAMQKKESKFQHFKNNAVSLVCVIALLLLCSEPAEGTSYNDWFIWEGIWLAVFVGSAIYLNKHLPEDDNNDRA